MGGMIQNAKVRTLTPLYRPGARKALVTVGLWEQLSNQDIQIHNYSQWNKTNEERSASARNAAQVRWSRENDIARRAGHAPRNANA